MSSVDQRVSYAVCRVPDLEISAHTVPVRCPCWSAIDGSRISNFLHLDMASRSGALRHLRVVGALTACLPHEHRDVESDG